MRIQMQMQERIRLPEGIFDARCSDVHSHSYDFRVDDSRRASLICRKASESECKLYWGQSERIKDTELYRIVVGEYDTKELARYGLSGSDIKRCPTVYDGRLLLNGGDDLTKRVEDEVNRIYHRDGIAGFFRMLRSHAIFFDGGVQKKEFGDA